MTTEFKLAAVGDILMIGPLIPSAKLPNSNQYSFDSIFKDIVPYLKEADLVIGNLETPLAGKDSQYPSKKNNTRYSKYNFSCPDELATTLKKSGFHVLTTGNNHCMDRGVNGLKRTLRVLDQYGLEHTGTFLADPGTENHLIKEINGIRVAIVSYTKGTNRIPLPKGQSWLVNRLNAKNPKNIIRHIDRLKNKVDVIIACLHFGKEYRDYPTQQQRKWVDLMLKSGVHIVLGCHPHVLQPMVFTKNNKQFATYSLGNFISTRLQHDPFTNCGMILRLTISKNGNENIKIKDVFYIPTWTTRIGSKRNIKYRILPIHKTLKIPFPHQRKSDRLLMKKIWKHKKALLKGDAR